MLAHDGVPTHFSNAVAVRSLQVIERFGEFTRIAPPGLNCICWPIDSVAGTISTRVQQLEVVTLTKTKDNVGVHVKVAVQYLANADQVVHLESLSNLLTSCRVEQGLQQTSSTQVYDAYYKLTNVPTQINSYVDDVVRATLPTLELDHVLFVCAFCILRRCRPLLYGRHRLHHICDQ